MIKFIRDQNFIALIYLLFSVFIASIATGINVISFPAILVENNIAPFFIGIATTVEVAANIAISFLLSRIIFRLTITKAMLLCAATYSLSIALIFFYQNFPLWLMFCTINGMCWFTLFIIRQSWISTLVKTKNRSVFLALITTILCCGFICGSFVVKYFGAEHYTPFLVSSAFTLLSILILIPIQQTQPKRIQARRIGLREFFKHNPRITVARFLLDLQGGCLTCFTVIFGIKVGFTIENSGLLISAYMASGFYDLYAGFLAKRFDRYKMISLGFVACLTFMLIAIFVYKSYVALLIIFFLFGCGTALILSGSITITNEIFAKHKLIGANSTFQSIGAIGFLAGSLIGGIAIEFFSFYGFFITIIFTNLAYFLFLAFYQIFMAKVTASNHQHKL